MNGLQCVKVVFRKMMKPVWTNWNLGSMKTVVLSLCLVLVCVFILSMLGLPLPMDIRDIIGILRFQDRPSRLCISYDGRLGNVIFRFASMYGIAKSKEMVPFISRDNRLYKIFELNGLISVNDRLCRWFKSHTEIRSVAFDKESVNFSNATDIALSGYFQSFRYFKDNNDKLRELLKIKADILETAKENLLQAMNNQLGDDRGSKVTFVGIHVRRGDFVSVKRHRDFGYLVGSKEYIEHAMEFYRSQYDRVIFVVCSDTMSWCKESILHSNTVFVEGQSPELDMATLSLCNHTIMTVGSFGWWSAWLANGKTVYYKHQFKNGSGLSQVFNMTDYFPSDWIAME